MSSSNSHSNNPTDETLPPNLPAAKKPRLMTFDYTEYPDVMIDLETLSTRSNAVILTIGAIKFSRKSAQLPQLETMNTFYRRVNLRSCLDIGCHIDDETIAWWERQDPAARNEAFALENRHEIKQVMIDFANWFRPSKYPWSHGATFDIPIISEIFARLEMKPPWEFYNGRDTRTLYDVAGITARDLPQDSYHSAVHDCHRQIWGVQEAYRRCPNLK